MLSRENFRLFLIVMFFLVLLFVWTFPGLPDGPLWIEPLPFPP
jgi:hypothetical protein